MTNAQRHVTVQAGGATYTAQFQPQTATVTVLANPAQGGTVSGDGTYPVGTNIQITATAAALWQFNGWNDGITNALRSVDVPVGGATYTAQFQPQMTLITVLADPVEGGTVNGSGTYLVGTNVQISASPANNCWTLTGWSDGATNATRIIIAPAGGATYTANFQPQSGTTIRVTAMPTNAGTVSGGGSYPCGSQQTITAQANSGWRFGGWSDGSPEISRTVKIPETAVTYTAYFQSLTDYVKISKETYQDKIGYDSSKKSYLYPSGAFTISGVLFNGAGLTAANLSNNTPVEITIGNWTYQGIHNTLRDDPTYKARAVKAKLPLTYIDSTGKTKSAGSVTLGFGKKNMTIAITSQVGQDAKQKPIQNFIAANTLDGAAAIGKTVATNVTINLQITIGDYSDWFTNVVMTGTDAAKSNKAKDRTYRLDTITIKGTAQ